MFELELCCASYGMLIATSPALLLNDSFHLLGFSMMTGIDTGTGTGSGGSKPGND